MNTIFSPTVIDLFILFALYLLLPVIPAVLIFLIFPKTNLNLKGPLQGLTLNASGAFAGYIVCCLLGTFIALSALDAIKFEQRRKSAWLIKAKINLISDNSCPALSSIERDSSLEKFMPSIIQIIPNTIRTNNNGVVFYLPEALITPDLNINFTIPGFKPHTIDKEGLDTAQTDKIYNVIDLKTINLISKPCNQNQYSSQNRMVNGVAGNPTLRPNNITPTPPPKQK
jgi:hypothetical protein